MPDRERTVLVVEDDRVAQATFTLLLRQKGYTTLPQTTAQRRSSRSERRPSIW